MRRNDFVSPTGVERDHQAETVELLRNLDKEDDDRTQSLHQMIVAKRGFDSLATAWFLLRDTVHETINAQLPTKLTTLVEEYLESVVDDGSSSSAATPSTGYFQQPREAGRQDHDTQSVYSRVVSRVPSRGNMSAISRTSSTVGKGSVLQGASPSGLAGFAVEKLGADLVTGATPQAKKFRLQMRDMLVNFVELCDEAVWSAVEADDEARIAQIIRERGVSYNEAKMFMRREALNVLETMTAIYDTDKNDNSSTSTRGAGGQTADHQPPTSALVSAGGRGFMDERTHAALLSRVAHQQRLVEEYKSKYEFTRHKLDQQKHIMKTVRQTVYQEVAALKRYIFNREQNMSLVSMTESEAMQFSMFDVLDILEKAEQTEDLVETVRKQLTAERDLIERSHDRTLKEQDARHHREVEKLRKEFDALRASGERELRKGNIGLRDRLADMRDAHQRSLLERDKLKKELDEKRKVIEGLEGEISVLKTNVASLEAQVMDSSLSTRKSFTASDPFAQSLATTSANLADARSLSFNLPTSSDAGASSATYEGGRGRKSLGSMRKPGSSASPDNPSARRRKSLAPAGALAPEPSQDLSKEPSSVGGVVRSPSGSPSKGSGRKSLSSSGNKLEVNDDGNEDGLTPLSPSDTGASFEVEDGRTAARRARRSTRRTPIRLTPQKSTIGCQTDESRLNDSSSSVAVDDAGAEVVSDPFEIMKPLETVTEPKVPKQPARRKSKAAHLTRRETTTKAKPPKSPANKRKVSVGSSPGPTRRVSSPKPSTPAAETSPKEDRKSSSPDTVSQTGSGAQTPTDGGSRQDTPIKEGNQLGVEAAAQTVAVEKTFSIDHSTQAEMVCMSCRELTAQLVSLMKETDERGVGASPPGTPSTTRSGTPLGSDYGSLTDDETTEIDESLIKGQDVVLSADAMMVAGALNRGITMPLYATPHLLIATVLDEKSRGTVVYTVNCHGGIVVQQKNYNTEVMPCRIAAVFPTLTAALQTAQLMLTTAPAMAIHDGHFICLQNAMTEPLHTIEGGHVNGTAVLHEIAHELVIREENPTILVSVADTTWLDLPAIDRRRFSVKRNCGLQNGCCPNHAVGRILPLAEGLVNVSGLSEIMGSTFYSPLESAVTVTPPSYLSGAPTIVWLIPSSELAARGASTIFCTGNGEVLFTRPQEQVWAFRSPTAALHALLELTAILKHLDGVSLPQNAGVVQFSAPLRMRADAAEISVICDDGPQLQKWMLVRRLALQGKGTLFSSDVGAGLTSHAILKQCRVVSTNLTAHLEPVELDPMIGDTRSDGSPASSPTRQRDGTASVSANAHQSPDAYVLHASCWDIGGPREEILAAHRETALRAITGADVIALSPAVLRDHLLFGGKTPANIIRQWNSLSVVVVLDVMRCSGSDPVPADVEAGPHVGGESTFFASVRGPTASTFRKDTAATAAGFGTTPAELDAEVQEKFSSMVRVACSIFRGTQCRKVGDTQVVIFSSLLVAVECLSSMQIMMPRINWSRAAHRTFPASHEIRGGDIVYSGPRFRAALTTGYVSIQHFTIGENEEIEYRGPMLRPAMMMVEQTLFGVVAMKQDNYLEVDKRIPKIVSQAGLDCFRCCSVGDLFPTVEKCTMTTISDQSSLVGIVPSRYQQCYQFSNDLVPVPFTAEHYVAVGRLLYNHGTLPPTRRVFVLVFAWKDGIPSANELLEMARECSACVLDTESVDGAGSHRVPNHGHLRERAMFLIESATEVIRFVTTYSQRYVIGVAYSEQACLRALSKAQDNYSFKLFNGVASRSNYMCDMCPRQNVLFDAAAAERLKGVAELHPLLREVAPYGTVEPLRMYSLKAIPELAFKGAGLGSHKEGPFLEQKNYSYAAESPPLEPIEAIMAIPIRCDVDVGSVSSARSSRRTSAAASPVSGLPHNNDAGDLDDEEDADSTIRALLRAIADGRSSFFVCGTHDVTTRRKRQQFVVYTVACTSTTSAIALSQRFPAVVHFPEDSHYTYVHFSGQYSSAFRLGEHFFSQVPLTLLPYLLDWAAWSQSTNALRGIEIRPCFTPTSDRVLLGGAPVEFAPSIPADVLAPSMSAEAVDLDATRPVFTSSLVSSVACPPSGLVYFALVKACDIDINEVGQALHEPAMRMFTAVATGLALKHGGTVLPPPADNNPSLLMYAFVTQESALRFSVLLQEELLCAPWPRFIVEQQPFQPQSNEGVVFGSRGAVQGFEASTTMIYRGIRGSVLLCRHSATWMRSTKTWRYSVDVTSMALHAPRLRGGATVIERDICEEMVAAHEDTNMRYLVVGQLELFGEERTMAGVAVKQKSARDLTLLPLLEIPDFAVWQYLGADVPRRGYVAVCIAQKSMLGSVRLEAGAVGGVEFVVDTRFPELAPSLSDVLKGSQLLEEALFMQQQYCVIGFTFTNPTVVTTFVCSILPAAAVGVHYGELRAPTPQQSRSFAYQCETVLTAVHLALVALANSPGGSDCALLSPSVATDCGSPLLEHVACATSISLRGTPTLLEPPSTAATEAAIKSMQRAGGRGGGKGGPGSSLMAGQPPQVTAVSGSTIKFVDSGTTFADQEWAMLQRCGPFACAPNTTTDMLVFWEVPDSRLKASIYLFAVQRGGVPVLDYHGEQHELWLCFPDFEAFVAFLRPVRENYPSSRLCVFAVPRVKDRELGVRVESDSSKDASAPSSPDSSSTVQGAMVVTLPDVTLLHPALLQKNAFGAINDIGEGEESWVGSKAVPKRVEKETSSSLSPKASKAQLRRGTVTDDGGTGDSPKAPQQGMAETTVLKPYTFKRLLTQRHGPPVTASDYYTAAAMAAAPKNSGRIQVRPPLSAAVYAISIAFVAPVVTDSVGQHISTALHILSMCNAYVYSVQQSPAAVIVTPPSGGASAVPSRGTPKRQETRPPHCVALVAATVTGEAAMARFFVLVADLQKNRSVVSSVGVKQGAFKSAAVQQAVPTTTLFQIACCEVPHPVRWVPRSAHHASAAATCGEAAPYLLHPADITTPTVVDYCARLAATAPPVDTKAESINFETTTPTLQVNILLPGELRQLALMCFPRGLFDESPATEEYLLFSPRRERCGATSTIVVPFNSIGAMEPRASKDKRKIPLLLRVRWDDNDPFRHTLAFTQCLANHDIISLERMHGADFISTVTPAAAADLVADLQAFLQEVVPRDVRNWPCRADIAAVLSPRQKAGEGLSATDPIPTTMHFTETLCAFVHDMDREFLGPDGCGDSDIGSWVVGPKGIKMTSRAMEQWITKSAPSRQQKAREAAGGDGLEYSGSLADMAFDEYGVEHRDEDDVDVPIVEEGSSEGASGAQKAVESGTKTATSSRQTSSLTSSRKTPGGKRIVKKRITVKRRVEKAAAGGTAAKVSGSTATGPTKGKKSVRFHGVADAGGGADASTVGDGDDSKEAGAAESDDSADDYYEEVEEEIEEEVTDEEDVLLEGDEAAVGPTTDDRTSIGGTTVAAKPGGEKESVVDARKNQEEEIAGQREPSSEKKLPIPTEDGGQGGVVAGGGAASGDSTTSTPPPPSQHLSLVEVVSVAVMTDPVTIDELVKDPADARTSQPEGDEAEKKSVTAAELGPLLPLKPPPRRIPAVAPRPKKAPLILIPTPPAAPSGASGTTPPETPADSALEPAASRVVSGSGDEDHHSEGGGGGGQRSTTKNTPPPTPQVFRLIEKTIVATTDGVGTKRGKHGTSARPGSAPAIAHARARQVVSTQVVVKTKPTNAQPPPHITVHQICNGDERSTCAGIPAGVISHKHYAHSPTNSAALRSPVGSNNPGSASSDSSSMPPQLLPDSLPSTSFGRHMQMLARSKAAKGPPHPPV